MMRCWCCDDDGDNDDDGDDDDVDGDTAADDCWWGFAPLLSHHVWQERVTNWSTKNVVRGWLLS